MKSIHLNIIYILSAIIAAVAAVSCTDDTFLGDGQTRLPDNMIRFDVSSGIENIGLTRTGETIINDSDLVPVLISNGKDSIYIHRYVGNESERATGREFYDGTTRGTQVNTGNFRAICEKFKVHANFVSDGSTYIPDSEVVPLGDDGNTWYVKEPKYFWPDEKQLRFNAFAPASAESALNGLNIGGETLSFTYTVPVSDSEPRIDAEKQPDIMLATTVCSRKTGSLNSNYAPLNFRHALSAIKFAVRDVANGKIIDITLKGLSGSGSCTFHPDRESAPAFEWSGLGEKNAEYKQTFNYETTEHEYNDIPSLSNATVINDTEGMNDKTFMLIPQTISDNAELIITFQTSDGISKTLKGKLKSPEIPVWEAGKEYIYTISTSKEVWTYYFDVTGSVQEENNENPAKGVISDNSDNIIVNPTVVDGAYYKVKSYRVRKNNPNVKEPVAWTAETTIGTNTGTERFQPYINKYGVDVPMTVNPDAWFPEIGIPESGNKLSVDSNGKFSGEGSVEAKKYNVKFKTQYVATNWDGDWEMRSKSEIGTDSPLDLSFYNSNGSSSGNRTTANCYVVNRGGWYKIPLVYGNAISNGNTNNRSSYTFDGSTVSVTREGASWSFPALKNFTDYKGDPISSPFISGADHPKLVWQDAYGIIDQIELDGSYLKFHVARADLQQSNSVIAVCDSNDEIIWSWHIWVNELMVDYETQKLSNGIDCETWSEADAVAGYGPFEIALRNLGWCDPKTVSYLRRVGSITFKQVGGKTENKTLNVEQRGKDIEFYIGNNTYYQWGRKDPMVGFRYSDESADYVKYNFGEIPYDYMDYTSTTIADGIKNPSLFLAGIYGDDKRNWINEEFYNLWNNYYSSGKEYFEKEGDKFLFELQSDNPSDPTNAPLPTREFGYSGVKTIYDPSPAGFMVPPQKFFELLTKGQDAHRYVNPNPYGKVNLSDVFNGNREQKTTYYQYNGSTKRDGTGDNEIKLTGTGQRWHRKGHNTFKLGGNMNPNHIYLWPNSVSFNLEKDAISFVVGDEGKFISSSRMFARHSIARPIRSVREGWRMGND